MNAKTVLIAASFVALAGVSAVPSVAADPTPQSLTDCVVFMAGGIAGTDCGEPTGANGWIGKELADCQNRLETDHNPDQCADSPF